MTSQDNERYVTVEMFNKGIAELKAEIRNNYEELRAEIRAIEKRVDINTAKIDGLQFYIGNWFTVMAVVVGIVGFMLTLAPMFRDMYKDRKQMKSEQLKRDILKELRPELKSMIDEIRAQ